MNYSDYYNEAYQKYHSLSTEELINQLVPLSKGQMQFVLESKSKFIEHKDWQGLRVLELGSGIGALSLLLARMGAKVSIVDFSQMAIDLAKKIFKHEGLEVQAHVLDLTLPQPDLMNQYDIIIDGHLLHCLTEDHERASYYELVKELLADDGIFVCETMVHKKKIFIPENFKFDVDTYTLWQFLGSWRPVRKIADSLDLEKEIASHHLQIKSFFYYAQMGVVPHESFMDLPVDILPAAVRMVLSR